MQQDSDKEHLADAALKASHTLGNRRTTKDWDPPHRPQAKAASNACMYKVSRSIWPNPACGTASPKPRLGPCHVPLPACHALSAQPNHQAEEIATLRMARPLCWLRQVACRIPVSRQIAWLRCQLTVPAVTLLPGGLHSIGQKRPSTGFGLRSFDFSNKMQTREPGPGILEGRLHPCFELGRDPNRSEKHSGLEALIALSFLN
jgi:hypothetical protein